MINKKAFLLLSILSGIAGSAALAATDPDPVARGRYLVKLSGCNDCHTSGYMPGNGEVPEEQWLMGDSIGFRGPWGTTYPVNLRLFMQEFDEDAWVEHARNLQTRPPMPWFNLRSADEDDLRAIYRYVRALGPAGSAAPEAVAPGEEPNTPYFLFEPIAPKG